MNVLIIAFVALALSIISAPIVTLGTAVSLYHFGGILGIERAREEVHDNDKHLLELSKDILERNYKQEKAYEEFRKKYSLKNKTAVTNKLKATENKLRKTVNKLSLSLEGK